MTKGNVKRVGVALALAGTLVAFSAETNYMSLKGFMRWKTYESTKVWAHGKGKDGPKNDGPKDGPKHEGPKEGPKGPEVVGPSGDGPGVQPCEQQACDPGGSNR